MTKFNFRASFFFSFLSILLTNVYQIASSTTIQSKSPHTFLNPSRITNVASTNNIPVTTNSNTIVSIRGGSTTSSDASKALSANLKWRIQQQQLLQLRSTFLSEALAARGIPLTTMMEVSTLDSDKPPDEIDWDCVLSTESDPKVNIFAVNTIRQCDHILMNYKCFTLTVLCSKFSRFNTI